MSVSYPIYIQWILFKMEFVLKKIHLIQNLRIFVAKSGLSRHKKSKHLENKCWFVFCCKNVGENVSLPELKHVQIIIMAANGKLMKVLRQYSKLHNKLEASYSDFALKISCQTCCQFWKNSYFTATWFENHYYVSYWKV